MKLRIGYLKVDHGMRRNLLKGALGNTMNPILAGAGINIRWLTRWLVVLWRWLLSGVLGLLEQGGMSARANVTPADA